MNRARVKSEMKKGRNDEENAGRMSAESTRRDEGERRGLKRTAKCRRTDFLLILLPFSDPSLLAGSSDGGVGEAGSFLARAGAMSTDVGGLR